MDYDRDKVDEVVLALLYLVSSEDRYGRRAWKGMNLEAMKRLYARGAISDPMEKSTSVTLSAEGARLAEELCRRYFARQADAPESVEKDSTAL